MKPLKMNSNHKFNHHTSVQIRFNDLDIMGHVNNSVHQHFFDYGRMKYFEHVLGEDINWDKNSLLLAHIEIDYFKPVFLSDTIEIHTKILSIGTKSVRMLQYCINKETGEEKSMNDAVLVGFSKQLNESIEIPEKWRAKISKFENWDD